MDSAYTMINFRKPELAHELLDKVHNIVVLNVDKPDFTIEDMAMELGFSRTDFYRKFKRILHMPPKEYMRNYRLKKAAQLLKESDMLVCEVTSLVGYNDLKYFRETFQKQFGLTPSQYISKNRN